MCREYVISALKGIVVGGAIGLIIGYILAKNKRKA